MKSVRNVHQFWNNAPPPKQLMHCIKCFSGRSIDTILMQISYGSHPKFFGIPTAVRPLEY